MSILQFPDRRPNLYVRLEESQRQKAVLTNIDRDLRALWWRRRLAPIGWTCYVVGVLILCYFAFRIGHGR